MTKKHKPIGSSFDRFLADEHLTEEAHKLAVKKILALQLQTEMQRLNISKLQMARRMKTSRSALERLLDESNGSVTLDTMNRAAAAIGKYVRIEFSNRPLV